MGFRKLSALPSAAMAVLALLLLLACGDADAEPGLTAAEVREIVRAELAEAPAPSQPGTGVTSAEAEHIARGVVASIPLKTSPADYTAFFVDSAIARYETQGLDATLAHYSREESIDGQWYVFIVGGDDRLIAHPNPYRLGLDLKGWVGTDANGYDYGPEVLSATEEGKWVTYVYRNPESGGSIGPGHTGEFELKNVWVVRHDGLLFCSGWYVSADEFAQQLVSVAVEKFRSGGLEGTMEYFANPGSALAGLETAVAYYNSAETVDGRWSAFIADESGRFVGHSDPAMIGREVRELFGTELPEATGEGGWVTGDSMRIWVAESGGYLFGSGWHHGVAGPGG